VLSLVERCLVFGGGCASVSKDPSTGAAKQTADAIGQEHAAGYAGRGRKRRRQKATRSGWRWLSPRALIRPVCWAGSIRIASSILRDPSATKKTRRASPLGDPRLLSELLELLDP